MSNFGVNSTPQTFKSYANGIKALVQTTFDAKTKKNHLDGIVYEDTTELWIDRIGQVGVSKNIGVWSDGNRPGLGTIAEQYFQTFTQVPLAQDIAIGRLFKQFQANDLRANQRAAKALAGFFYQEKQKSMASLFNYGFSDTNTFLGNQTGQTVSALLPDGKRLFSVVHPVAPGSSATYSNANATNAALSDSALEDAFVALDAQADHNGDLKHYGSADGEGYILIVPVALKKKALKITKSEKVEDSADNGINVYAGGYDGYDVEVRVMPWLTSSTAWFVMAKAAYDEMPLVCLESMAFKPEEVEDVMTATGYVRASQSYSVGAVTGYGLYGSQGTASGTYTS